MSLYILSIIIQIGFVVHVVRTGRNFFWIYIILFIPVIGWIAYLAAEVLPPYLSGHKAQMAGVAIKKALDPGKDIREARQRLDIAPTVANRIALGRLLLDRGESEEAIAVVSPGLTDFFAGDPAILEILAAGYFNKKDYAQSLSYIERIMENKDFPVKAQIELLRARIHEIQNEPEAAENLYTRLAKTASGEEAKVAYGQFLIRYNRRDEAKAIFQDITKRSQSMSAHARKMEDEWIRTAQRELSKIS